MMGSRRRARPRVHDSSLDTGGAPVVRRTDPANDRPVSGVQWCVRSAISLSSRAERGILTDAELVAAVQRGSPAAEELLVRRHAPRVHRLAWRIAGDVEVARDLVQEVFVRMLAMLPRFRGEAEFTTWLHRVTSRRVSTRCAAFAGRVADEWR
jgi:hypothetical protein